jgi:hypothetical protein
MEGLYKIVRGENGSVCWNGRPVLRADLNDGGAGGLSGGVGFGYFSFPQQNPKKNNITGKSN